METTVKAAGRFVRVSSEWISDDIQPGEVEVRTPSDVLVMTWRDAEMLGLALVKTAAHAREQMKP
jgi:hypothetical protein